VADQNTNLAVAFEVTCVAKIDDDFLVSWVVDQDLGQPDMCSITIRNETHEYSNKYSIGNTVQVDAGDEKTPVFKGELVGIEPVYKANGENVVIVRAFNRLHRLTRSRKSKTYVQQNDKQIVEAIAGLHKLNPKCGDAASEITHEHIYQHNQTDLEFLRVRAARLGYEVWVEDTDLYFDAPDPGNDSGIKLRYGDAKTSQEGGEVFVKRFAPRLSSARVLEEVTVRGWDPSKKEEIVGTFKAQNSPLGNTPAHSATLKGFTDIKSFEVDHPIYSVDEAKKIAEAKVSEATMGYITGDGECRGTPGIKPGVVITITVNGDDEADRFNGKYMVIGATHKYTHAKTGDTGGYVTGFRVSRDAEGGG
jgi:uncharacterized protein